jgi:hypothetical protein
MFYILLIRTVLGKFQVKTHGFAANTQVPDKNATFPDGFACGQKNYAKRIDTPTLRLQCEKSSDRTYTGGPHLDYPTAAVAHRTGPAQNVPSGGCQRI